MKKIVFRFDIDTHKCIRDGVPNLLYLSEEMGVPFTFYLNLGRSISFYESIKDILCALSHNEIETSDKIEMMSAKEKLGIKDFLIAALLNPRISKYKCEIERMCNSICEVGIHGGRNHALWHKYAKRWDEKKIRNELEWSLNQLRHIDANYSPCGFASPGWSSPESLLQILKDMGFKYAADIRVKGKDAKYLVDDSGVLSLIGVNLLGEPGGVAFFENCRVKGWTTEKIVEYVMKEVVEHEICVLYDHPYYAGINEIDTIKKIIEEAKEREIIVSRIIDLL